MRLEGHTRRWTAIVLLTALGGALRFATLDRQSFWLDELVTVSLLDRSLGDMLAEIRRSEATPYLYYLVAWPWARVAGLGEVGLRSLSAVFGTLTIPVAYAAGAAFTTRRVGLVAAALVAVHPLLVWYSQEARSYALLVLLGALSVFFLGRALATSRSADLVGWALASSLAIATHHFAIFLVLAEAAWLVARSRPRRPAVAASLVPLAAVGAHVPLVLAQRDNGSAVAATSLLSRLAGVPKGLVVGYSFPLEIVGSVLAAVLVLAGLALLMTRSSVEERHGAMVAGSLALAAVAVPTVAALAGADYVTARNLVVAIVPGAVCIAAGYASGRLGLALGGVLCVLLLAIALGVSLDARYGRTDWRGAAERLERPDVDRAIVVTPYLSRSLWRPYLMGLREPGGSEVVVDEIALVGLATEGGFSGGRVKPPDVPPPSPPGGFVLVSTERSPTLTLYRYRAPRPTAVSTTTLSGLRLADQQPGILLQPPSARPDAETLGPRRWLASPG